MISHRCTGVNLLNYLNQKNIEYTLEFRLITGKSNIRCYEWEGIFTFNGETFVEYHRNKKGVKTLLLEKNVDYIHRVLNIVSL